MSSKRRVYGNYGEVRAGDHIPYGDFSKYGHGKAVYRIKSKTAGKVYIGSTTNVQHRLSKHFSELFFNRHRNKRLQEDFNKYGYTDFEIIIYDNNPETDIAEKETETQIAIGIDDIYNEKVTGYYITEELRQRIKNSDKSSHKTEEYREKMRKLKTNRVAQYTLDMQKIKEWDSAKQIRDVLGYTVSVILSCCNRNKPHAYGYNWRYVDDNGNIVLNGYDKARKKRN